MLRSASAIVMLTLALCPGLVLSASDNELKAGQQQLEELLQNYRDEEDKLKAEMLKSHDSDYVSQRFVFEAPFEKLAYFGPEFLKVARNHPNTEVAWIALQQVACGPGFADVDKLTAMRSQIRDHSTREEFYKRVYYHHYRPGIDANKFSRLILESQSVSPEIVGVAKYTLATGLAGALTNEESISENDRVEALELLRSVQQNHAALPHPNNNDKRTLGEAASDLEFLITHLMVGQVAPEIVGTDVEGTIIRLSDYRGKVILIVFCGEWCAPCRAMYPYEKLFLEDLGDQGFSILGINSDPKETLAEAIEREQFPWKWIWDGGTTQGPISRKWGINNWPSFVLVDRLGVIQKKKFKGESTKERAQDVRNQIESMIKVK